MPFRIFNEVLQSSLAIRLFHSVSNEYLFSSLETTPSASNKSPACIFSVNAPAVPQLTNALTSFFISICAAARAFSSPMPQTIAIACSLICIAILVGIVLSVRQFASADNAQTMPIQLKAVGLDCCI